jgi:hypothetical protein
MGSAEGGLFAAQLLAWSDAAGGPLLRSDAAWEAATALPADRVRAAARRCVALGFLEVRAGPPGAEGQRCYRLLRAPLLRLLTALLRGEESEKQALPRAVRRRPVRRKLRLPVRGGPARRRQASTRQPARRALRVAPANESGALPALTAVRVVEAGAASPNGSRPAARGAGQHTNGTRAQANGARPAHKSRARASAGPFDEQRWELALAELSRKVPRQVYTRWLAGSHFAAVEGGTVVVAVDDKNTAWWLNTRLIRVVERAVNLVAPGTEWLAVEARAM